MCDKIPYDTKTEARQTAQGMSREHSISMGFYQCTDCGKWHTETRGKKPKRKRNNNKYPFRYYHNPNNKK